MDLELEDHSRFQRREWRAERFGWAAITLFVVAGFLGAFGTGPLSWTTAAAGAIAVDLDRVTHHEADDSIVLHLDTDAAAGDLVTVELTGDWPSAVDIQGISPEPTEQRLIPGGLVLELTVEEPGVHEVTVTFRAQQYGPVEGQVTVGADTVSFRQLVMP